jgi:hypothetical protein
MIRTPETQMPATSAGITQKKFDLFSTAPAIVPAPHRSHADH